MKCLQCQIELPDDAQFCNKCGGKLEQSCPECGRANPPDSNFCLKCGHDLRKPKEAPSIDYNAPQSYTPKFLADKILTSRSALEGERKLVTVLFADVAGFTAMSEKLDPEDVHEIMDGCFRILMDQIHRFEGTVNEFRGDGVMALFGAPIAHEDHAQRACHASLAIQEALIPYSAKLHDEYGVDFKMRIGLNSGPVVVGAIGDDLRTDYTALGDTANLAARMETNAQPGSVLLSEHTHRLAKEFFEFEPVGEIQVKGKEKPVKAYSLTRPSEVETRIAASAAKGLTRFVGRRRELETLKEALDRAKKGEGQVVGVVGEAGVGKSRLLLEFRNSLPKGECIYLEGRCLHYGSSMPYLPILDALRSYLGIREGEQESVIRQKMRDRIVGTDDNLTRCLSPIQELFSVRVEDTEFLNLEPKQKREKTFEALRDILIRGSESGPIVLAVEDLHWIDQTTQEFLDYMIGWLPSARILMILIYRPEYTHQWGSKSYYSKIGVGQLPMDTSAELVQAILEGGAVVPELRELILSRASGNPLFMEELTHSLLENGSVQKEGDQYVLARAASEIQVPDTIQGIIAARMDRLEEALKQIMQVASVIGREFAFRVLESITEMKQELKSCLLNLQGLEFIYEKSLFPELEYIFRHALTQEVAYNSLLLKRRKEIHEKIGEAIEELYPERLEDFYEVLSYHYSKSDNPDKAIKYWHLAAKRALSLYAVNEAVQYLSCALENIDRLPPTDARKDLKLKLGTKLGFAYLLRNLYSEAMETVGPLESIAIERGHLKSLARIYTVMGIFEATNKLKLKQGIEHLEKARKLAEQTKDLPALSFSSTYLFSPCWALGEFEVAKRASASLIPILEEKRSWYTLCVPYYIETRISLDTGDAELAEHWAHKGYQCIDKLDDPFTRSWGNLAMGEFLLERGELDLAEERLTSALKSAKEISLHVSLECSLISLIRLRLRTRAYDRGLSEAQELKNTIQHKSGLFIYMGPCCCLEAENFIYLGQLEKTKEYLDASLNYTIPSWEGYLYRVFADYYRSLDPVDFGTAEGYYRRAVDSHKRIGMALEMARDLSSYGEMLMQKGNTEMSKSLFEEALDIFRPLGADWDIQRVQRAIVNL